MPYPVRLLSGTDRVQTRPPDGPFYEIGERIDDLDDEARISLQRSGIRFEAIHDDAPADLPALTAEIAADAPAAEKAGPAKKGDN